MNKKLNVAIIGQGRSGRDIHGCYLLTDAAKELFHVVAVVDLIPGRRERAAKEFECDVYADYRELFKRDDIDFVVNATFSHMHYPITMDLLNHKMNVLVEKPFSKYSMECEQMLQAAKDNGVMLAVFQQSRFAPYFVKMKEIIESGVLGNIHQIHFDFSGYSRRWDWQCSNRFYAGNLLNTGPHPMDMALDILDIPDDEIPSVFSVLKQINTTGDAEDYVKLILTYPGKPLVEVDMNPADAYPGCKCKVCGDRGTLQTNMETVEWKYFEAEPIPEMVLGALTKEDGVTPAYCGYYEKMEWHEFSEKMEGGSVDVGTRRLYENIYNHLTRGEELVVRVEKVIQQIRIAELAHAQNPMKTRY